MILKKPYAFLVKHFRIIHGALFLGALLIFMHFKSISQFFDTYVDDDLKYSGIDTLTTQYANWTTYLLIVLVITLFGVIFSLLIHKKKPKVFYIIGLVNYIISFIALFLLSEFFYGLQFSIPDLRFTMIIKDLLYVYTMLQIPLLFVLFIRTVGFDLKRFDFKKDLLDLGIEEEDNEEYILDFTLDSEEIKARLRKRFRYIKYFYLENKLIFYAAGAFVLAATLLLGFYKIITMEKIYSEGEVFSITGLKAEVLESYKTNTDAKGEALSNNYFYLIIKMRFTNTSNYETTIYKDNVLVSYDGLESIVPTNKMEKKLNEFGINYYSQKLQPKETRDFVLVYEIKNEYYNSNLRLKYLWNGKVINGKFEYEYRTVRLKPKTFSSEEKKIDTKNLGEYITFTGSPLGDTKLRVNNISIADTFYFSVVKCVDTKCSSSLKAIKANQNSKFDMTLMRIDFDTIYDYETLGNGYVNSEIISKYGRIRFTYQGKEYNNRLALTNVTPYSTGKYIFIEVRDKLKNADKIFLDIVIRGKVYTIVIKDDTKPVEDINLTDITLNGKELELNKEGA